ncbi:MAG: DUF819 family protein [Xanthomonadales bacterium]|nr:DUF819 family protein [Xanthomonadales bacterium]
MIDPTNNSGLLAVLISVVALGIWMESRPKLAQFGVIVIILGCALLSGIGLLPRGADLYGVIVAYCVPLAIPLLLLNANLLKIWRESGRVFFAFLLAVAGVLGGAFLAAPLTTFGPDDGVWTGILTAGYIGGSANTAAVAAAMGKADEPFMALAVASAYAVAVPFMALLLAMPGIAWMWRLFSPRTDYIPPADGEESHSDTPQISGFSLVAGLALSAVIFWISDWVADLTQSGPMRYIALSVLSVALATLFPGRMQRLHGHYELGRILIYIFFAVIGVQINFALAIESGGQVMLYTVIVIATHLLVMAVGGRLFGFTGPELAIASNACVLGAPTAAAMAASKGWYTLVTPGLLVGVLGYATANLVGIALTTIL